MQIIMGTLEGLAAVHSVNLVHRDMKPDNVIMHDRGDGSKIPKIVDFGMAKGLRAPDGTALASQKLFMTEENMVAGSPEYMSPEQWAGIEKDIDFRSDIWAVGATLFQLLSGKPPYEAPPGQPRRNIIGQVLYDKRLAPDMRKVRRSHPLQSLDLFPSLRSCAGCGCRWRGMSAWRPSEPRGRRRATCPRMWRMRWQSRWQSRSANGLPRARRWRPRSRRQLPGSKRREAGRQRVREMVDNDVAALPARLPT